MYVFDSRDKWLLSRLETFMAGMLQALMTMWNGRQAGLVEGLVLM